MSDNKIDQILEICANEKLTRAELVARIGTTTNSLASYFTSLRLVAKFSPEKPLCPDTDADGKIILVPYPEYEERQATAAAGRTPKAPKTPREAYVAAEKTLQRAQKVLEGCSADETELDKLIKQRAEINVKIATIELSISEAAWRADQEANGSDEAVEPAVVGAEEGDETEME